MIGFILMGIITVPVIVLITASIFSKPRTFRVPSLFIGSIIVLFGIVMVVFAIFGSILGLFVPQ
jgi:hypothetical protein